MSIKDGRNAEQVAADRRAQDVARERAEWLQLQHIYERCIAIGEKVWGDKLKIAAAQQQTLAEQMRDRGTVYYVNIEGQRRMIEGPSIPVPLFTPRDRVQFLKEVGATLLIDARSHNLTAYYKDKNGETELAAAEKAPEAQGPVEAASGADEADADAPLALDQETPAGQLIPETAQPSL